MQDGYCKNTEIRLQDGYCKTTFIIFELLKVTQKSFWFYEGIMFLPQTLII